MFTNFILWVPNRILAGPPISELNLDKSTRSLKQGRCTKISMITLYYIAGTLFSKTSVLNTYYLKRFCYQDLARLGERNFWLSVDHWV
jgi:hypothetical protein